MRRWAGSLVKGLLLLWIAGTMACAAGAPISTAEPPPTPDFRAMIEEEVERILSAQSKSPYSISSPDLMPANTPVSVPNTPDALAETNEARKEKGCMLLDGQIVESGWAGKGTGNNHCNN